MILPSLSAKAPPFKLIVPLCWPVGFVPIQVMLLFSNTTSAFWMPCAAASVALGVSVVGFGGAVFASSAFGAWLQATPKSKMKAKA